MSIGLSELADLYKAGMPLVKILELTGHSSPEQVYRRLEKAGIAPGRNRMLSDVAITKKIRRMREKGEHYHKIAKAVGVSKDTVRRRLPGVQQIVRPCLIIPPPPPLKELPTLSRYVQPEERLRMKQLREAGLNIDEIAKSVRRSISAVRDGLYGPPPEEKKRIRRAPLPWPEVETTIDDAMKGRVFDEFRVPIGNEQVARKNGLFYEQLGARRY